VLKEMWHAGCRVMHPGSGLPEELVHEMFDRGRGMTQEGLGLSMCRKLVKLMNGDVQYVRDAGKSYFLVNVELPLAQRDDAGSVK
jgi:phytochrome B